ncbi:hypothetical protein CAMGR0001_0216 [Campylobacter gracilis RM3268]|uniref:Uncharacterized protein n=1 Tax=Campylobacter gracilis RM3268 TaxID=553220 RepID=C8PKJ4_9BACT|nr:hypothetical protein CAMGR0001_0216 [Campylobacter gracilis RM3268]
MARISIHSFYNISRELCKIKILTSFALISDRAFKCRRNF